MKPYRCGIVVGKFAPLHKGHEFLIGTALSQCEHVVVVSYCLPEFAGCDALQRRRWLQVLFPQVTMIVVSQHDVEHWHQTTDWRHAMPDNQAADALHQAFTFELLQRYGVTPVDAVFSSEPYGCDFARSLSERYRQHRPHHAVIAIDVDIPRIAVPVSARQIRADVHAHRHWLSPEVYGDFVETVCFLGAESTGKTTLARLLAERLQSRWVPEYGRERWTQRNGVLEWQDYPDIAHTQLTRESTLRGRSHQWLFCDTSPLTTLFYCLDQFGKAPDTLWQASHQTYSHIFLCYPDFPLVQDGTRRDEAFRSRQHHWFLDQLGHRGCVFTPLQGPLEHRISQVIHRLKTSSI